MGLLQTRLVKNALGSPRFVALLKAIVPRLDRFLLRLTRGWINTGFQSVALLRTLGARSGLPRELPTLCMPVDGGIVLVGSNWGGSSAPAWVHNLRAHPECRITYRGYRGPALAIELQGEERQAMWQRLVEFNPQYAVYQAQLSRTLPVIYLRRLQSHTSG